MPLACGLHTWFIFIARLRFGSRRCWIARVRFCCWRIGFRVRARCRWCGFGITGRRWCWLFVIGRRWRGLGVIGWWRSRFLVIRSRWCRLRVTRRFILSDQSHTQAKENRSANDRSSNPSCHNSSLQNKPSLSERNQHLIIPIVRILPIRSILIANKKSGLGFLQGRFGLTIGRFHLSTRPSR